MSPVAVTRSDSKARTSPVSPSMEEKSAAGFTFINLSEPRQSKDKDLKKIVRSNAMRTYRQMEKKKAIVERAQKAKLDRGGSESPLSSPNAESFNDWPVERESIRIDTQNSSRAEAQPLGLRVSHGSSRSLQPACGHTECNESGCVGRMIRQDVGRGPQALIGNSVADPFDIYPGGHSTQYNDYVLHHCKPPPPTANALSPISASPTSAD